MFEIVLVNPQIPQNTGAIGRLCVNNDTRLHIIKPIGFSLDEKAVRRAGLDYWKKLNLVVWESLDDFLKEVSLDRCYFATTKADKTIYEMEFEKNSFLLFGSETKGIPMELMKKRWDRAFKLPMGKNGRSLNLAMSVAAVWYCALAKVKE